MSRLTPVGRWRDDLAHGGPPVSTCFNCEQVIHQDPIDGAWCDDSGACGCGDGEHEPVDDDGFTYKDLHGRFPWES